MSIRGAIVRQFEMPRGTLGQLAGWIMANRPSNQQRNSWTVELLDLQRDDCVLELGCGPGIGLQHCLEKVKTGKVVGLDHSQTMLNQARRRNIRAVAAGRLQLRLGTLSDLQTERSTFDKVYLVNVVQFLEDRQTAFRAIHALLKPGGMAASTYLPRHKAATREDALRMADEIGDQMKATGFEDIQIGELPLQPVPAICATGVRP